MNDRITSMIDAYRQARVKLSFLDCNLWIGHPRSPEFVTEFDLASLCQRMKRYQIRGGVVSHFAAKEYSQIWGNEKLLEAIKGTDLWAGIVLVPEMFESEECGRTYLEKAICRGARLARVFPLSHNLNLRSWCGAGLLRTLVVQHLPLAIWHTEVSWEEIHSVCDSYPDLTVILEGTPQKILYHTRRFYPLLEQHSNLKLELHNLVNYLGIEDLVNRFGARCLIFGSYLPVYDPNAVMMQVTHARISEKDKALIARQNLIDLVAGVERL